jgi:hypothetical protein
VVEDWVNGMVPDWPPAVQATDQYVVAVMV